MGKKSRRTSAHLGFGYRRGEKMDGWKDSILEGLKHLGAKIATVAGTYLVANNVLGVVWTYVNMPSPEGQVALQLLFYGTGYSVWTKAIIPFVEASFATVMNKPVRRSPAAELAKADAKKYFDIL